MKLGKNRLVAAVVGVALFGLLSAVVAVAASGANHFGRSVTSWYGQGMMGGGYGPAGATGSSTSGKVSQRITLRVRSDAEHGRRGPDGAWHDAFLPAAFSVRAGTTVAVTVLNYDDMPHSFTSPMLAVNEMIAAGSAKHPRTTTFRFTAPARTGQYLWWCALPCDPFSMTHVG